MKSRIASQKRMKTKKNKGQQRSTQVNAGKRRRAQKTNGKEGKLKGNGTETNRNAGKRRKKQDNARKCEKGGTTLENITINEWNSRTTQSSI
jgi:hypothetical protein